MPTGTAATRIEKAKPFDLDYGLNSTREHASIRHRAGRHVQFTNKSKTYPHFEIVFNDPGFHPKRSQ